MAEPGLETPGFLLEQSCHTGRSRGSGLRSRSAPPGDGGRPATGRGAGRVCGWLAGVEVSRPQNKRPTGRLPAPCQPPSPPKRQGEGDQPAQSRSCQNRQQWKRKAKASNRLQKRHQETLHQISLRNGRSGSGRRGAWPGRAHMHNHPPAPPNSEADRICSRPPNLEAKGPGPNQTPPCPHFTDKKTEKN